MKVMEMLMLTTLFFQQERRLTPSSHSICFQHVRLDASAIQELYTVLI